MKTKTFIALLLIISPITFCSCGSLLGKSAILQVEKGMTKKQIVDLLGEPDFRRFDDRYEEWEYKKENVITGETKIIIVDFTNERVSNMNSFNGENLPTPPPPIAICPPADIDYGQPSYPTRPNGHRRPHKAVNDKDFQQLYDKVKQKPFKDEKLELLAMGVANKYFTCKQTIRLMSIFSFDDEQLSVLEIVAPRIVDAENYEDIIKSLSFISSEEKARKILRMSR